jgi:hypothetical protein
MAEGLTQYISPEKQAEFISGMRKRELDEESRLRNAFRQILGREPTELDYKNPELLGLAQGQRMKQRDEEELRYRGAQIKGQYGGMSRQYGDFLRANPRMG